TRTARHAPPNGRAAPHRRRPALKIALLPPSRKREQLLEPLIQLQVLHAHRRRAPLRGELRGGSQAPLHRARGLAVILPQTRRPARRARRMYAEDFVLKRDDGFAAAGVALAG